MSQASEQGCDDGWTSDGSFFLRQAPPRSNQYINRLFSSYHRYFSLIISMLKFRLHRHAKQNPSLRHQDFL
jgi:hypothetical protein